MSRSSKLCRDIPNFNAGVVVIAAGIAAFGPVRPRLVELAVYKRLGQGTGVNYFIQNSEDDENKSVIITRESILPLIVRWH